MSTVDKTIMLLPETVALVEKAEALGVHGLMFQNICLCPLRAWLHLQRVDCAHLNRHMRRGSAEQGLHYQGKVGALQGLGIAPDLVDFKQRIVSEVKVRKSFPQASKAQLLFYLAVLSVNTNMIWSGRLRYPTTRRVEAVYLTEIEQKWLIMLFEQIKALICSSTPPPRVEQRLCRDCSYSMVCWGCSSDEEDFT